MVAIPHGFRRGCGCSLCRDSRDIGNIDDTELDLSALDGDPSDDGELAGDDEDEEAMSKQPQPQPQRQQIVNILSISPDVVNEILKGQRETKAQLAMMHIESGIRDANDIAFRRTVRETLWRIFFGGLLIALLMSQMSCATASELQQVVAAQDVSTQRMVDALDRLAAGTATPVEVKAEIQAAAEEQKLATRIIVGSIEERVLSWWEVVMACLGTSIPVAGLVAARLNATRNKTSPARTEHEVGALVDARVAAAVAAALAGRSDTLAKSTPTNEAHTAPKTS